MAAYLDSSGLIVQGSSNWVGAASSSQALYSVGYVTASSSTSKVPSGGHWGVLYVNNDSSHRGYTTFAHCSGGMSMAGTVSGMKVLLWRLE